MSIKSNLIYDLGMHVGKDSGFYLQKGFNVIAVEANPLMVNAASQTFAAFISTGQLKIVDRAVCKSDGQSITFFVNDEKDDWSSIYKGAAEKGVTSAREITV